MAVIPECSLICIIETYHVIPCSVLNGRLLSVFVVYILEMTVIADTSSETGEMSEENDVPLSPVDRKKVKFQMSQESFDDKSRESVNKFYDVSVENVM